MWIRFRTGRSWCNFLWICWIRLAVTIAWSTRLGLLKVRPMRNSFGNFFKITRTLLVWSVHWQKGQLFPSRLRTCWSWIATARLSGHLSTEQIVEMCLYLSFSFCSYLPTSRSESFVWWFRSIFQFKWMVHWWTMVECDPSPSVRRVRLQVLTRFDLAMTFKPAQKQRGMSKRQVAVTLQSAYHDIHDLVTSEPPAEISIAWWDSSPL